MARVALPTLWLGVGPGCWAALQGEGLYWILVPMGEVHWAVCAPFPSGSSVCDA